MTERRGGISTEEEFLRHASVWGGEVVLNAVAEDGMAGPLPHLGI